jgi:hypothetical protein
VTEVSSALIVAVADATGNTIRLRSIKVVQMTPLARFDWHKRSFLRHSHLQALLRSRMLRWPWTMTKARLQALLGSRMLRWPWTSGRRTGRPTAACPVLRTHGPCPPARPPNASASTSAPSAELARQYGISRQRVREIVRSEASWIARNGPDEAGTEPSALPRQGSFRDLRELPAAIPRTRRMMVEP